MIPFLYVWYKLASQYIEFIAGIFLLMDSGEWTLTTRPMAVSWTLVLNRDIFQRLQVEHAIVMLTRFQGG